MHSSVWGLRQVRGLVPLCLFLTQVAIHDIAVPTTAEAAETGDLVEPVAERKGPDQEEI